MSTATMQRFPFLQPVVGSDQTQNVINNNKNNENINHNNNEKNQKRVEPDCSSSGHSQFVLQPHEQAKVKEALKYCVELRDFKIIDKYISQEILQNWEISKCQFMFRQHNMMEVLVSELFRLKGYQRKSNVIGRSSNTSLDVLYNEVNQSLQDLKVETMNLQPAFEESKRKHLIDMYGNQTNATFFIREQTPVELVFMQFSNLAEKIVEINQTVINEIINIILRMGK